MPSSFQRLSRLVLSGLFMSFTSVGCANANSAQQATSAVVIAEAPFLQPGKSDVTVRNDVWEDSKRGRDIPIKLYTPNSSVAPPVVIFSHGLGGSVEAAPYLGRHLASWGFLAIHIQHPGSDSEVWKGLRRRPKIFKALADAARDPQTSIDRFNDLHFVLDELEQRVENGAIQADLSRIGMAGHSFGAHSVLAASGRRSLSAQGLVSFKDKRIKAGLVLSPPAPAKWVTQDRYGDHYGDIDIPLMHITGTEDLSPLDQGRSAEERQIAFHQIEARPQYLIVFNGADHSVFGGMNRPGSPDWYPDIQARVAQAGTAFFESYLNEDNEALVFLKGAQFGQAFDSIAVTNRHP